ncbi:NADPH-dependent FMN reductase family protein [Taibaiella koreensis]|uniref:dialkylrecorsinol condensing enzyme DarA n=1 Tax=Taibaiella koreensis TaxID=1268548 RepID=UPI000E59B102|nr:dialkylrecorsinol condensing enzyme DarA [Taibaiella koreensis]
MKILVVYFTQSGQLKGILDNIVQDMKQEAEIDFAEIRLVQPFPFPWSSATFFDAMPESVLQVPAAIQPMPAIMDKDYDLVLFGYQPWFLHPSIPANSFLQSEWAVALRDKPVITVIGCRNMWLNAQEKVKAQLQRLGANHIGNIVLEDKHGNMTSTLTIIRWLFKGQKEASKRLPDAGVSDRDIRDTQRYGKPILRHIKEGQTEALQQDLLHLGAIHLRPNLIVLEKRGVSQFPKWAKKARDKGGPGAAERKPVIKLFSRILITAIFVLSPITALVAKIQTALKKKQLLKAVEYFKSTQYQPGRLG